MIKVFIVFVLLLALEIFVIEGQLIRVYTCSNMRSATCSLSNIYLEANESNFLPSSRLPITVNTLEITSSEIPTISSNICAAFSNIQMLHLADISIRNITEDAFISCKSLTTLYLQNNRIEILHPNTFNQNTNLQKLDLSYNHLIELPSNIFQELTQLSFLDLSQNQLVDISNVDFSYVRNMEELLLRHNPLTDFMLEKLYSVRHVYLQDTDILCDRIEELFNIAQQLGITIQDDSVGSYRTRDYEPTTFKYIKCLKRQQYEKEILFKTLPFTLYTIQEKLETVSNASVIDYSQRLLALESSVLETETKHREQVQKFKEELANVNMKLLELEIKFENLAENMTDAKYGQRTLKVLEQKIEFQLNAMLEFMKLQDVANKLAIKDVSTQETNEEQN